MSMDAYGTTEHAAQIHEEMEEEYSRERQAIEYGQQQYDRMIEQQEKTQT